MLERDLPQGADTNDPAQWPDFVYADGREIAPWPTIVLPQERRAQLEAKLAEYRGRIEGDDRRFQHPDMRLMLGDEVTSRITILERLLADGMVDTRELAMDLRDRLGEMYNPLTLALPILLIKDYCETGGMNTTGGTGLPKIEQTPTDPQPHIE